MGFQDEHYVSPEAGVGGRLEHVAHQRLVLGLRRPRGAPCAVVGSDERRAALVGEADRLTQVIGADLRMAQRRVRRQRRDLQIIGLGCALDPKGVVKQRDAVEVARLAEQLAASVDHRLRVLEAELGGLLHAPLK